MRSNGAYHRPGAGARLQDWWYGKTPAQRVNQLLYLAAGVSLVAFMNAANRDAGGTGSVATAGARPTVTSFAPTTSLGLSAAGLGTQVAAVGGSTTTTVPGTTTVSGVPVATTTTRPQSRVQAQPTPQPTPQPQPQPTTYVDPGVIFSDPPPTATPPTTTTVAPTTSVAPTTTSAAPTTTVAPPPATTSTTAKTILQLLLGG